MSDTVHPQTANREFGGRARKIVGKVLPSGLYGRAAVILIIPIVAMHLVIATGLIQRLYEGVTAQMTGNLALEIDLLLESHDSYATLARQASRLNIQTSTPVRPVADRRSFYDLSGRVVSDVLYARFSNLAGVDLVSVPGHVLLSFKTPNALLDMEFSRRRVTASNPHQLLVLMTFTAALMTLVAYVFLRRQLRPIHRLADAAEAFGRGEHDPFQPAGASEVRSAGLSFLKMRDRIEQ